MMHGFRPRHLRAVAEAAVAAGFLSHAFQPIWDLEHRLLVGFEALARFPGGEPPDAVWEEARRVPGDLWLELERVSIASAIREARDLPGLLFVNISGRYLYEPPPSPSVAAAKAAFRPQPGSLVLELTEDGPEAAAVSAELRGRLQRAGILLALDDAGLGSATPRRLLALAPDVSFVKVSREVVWAALEGRPGDLRQWLLRAAACGAHAIAEGIEDASALAVLRAEGVSWAQGYGLGRPLPAEHWTATELLPERTPTFA
jgi:EAL domain-containing protein (putative c-di-GMP-specific phosphodiesterase class I)